jgi:nucleoside-diphosphate-sugar epimerase
MTTKPKRVCITGVSGFIGSHLAEKLGRKYYVIGIDRVSPSDDTKKYIDEFYEDDINKSLPELDDLYAVVHLAARAGVRESERLFESYVTDNIVGTKNILSKCINDWEPEKCIITSSSSVYGDTKEPIHPKSPYALTKVSNELLLEMYKNMDIINPLKYTVIRPFTVYGPRQRKDLAISKFIHAILKDEPIEIFGNGYQSRDFTYVRDVVECVDRLLLPVVNFEYSEGYDIGSGNSYNLYEIIQIISTILRKPVTIKYSGAVPYDVKTTRAYTNPIYSTIGYTPNTPIAFGIEKQIEWIQKHEL